MTCNVSLCQDCRIATHSARVFASHVFRQLSDGINHDVNHAVPPVHCSLLSPEVAAVYNILFDVY